MSLQSARKTNLFTGPRGPPGSQGPPGNTGTNGTNGANGATWTTTTALFAQPAVNSNVSVSVVTTTWMLPNEYVFVAGGGYYQVASITSPTVVVLTNIGATGNVAPTAVVQTDAAVNPPINTIFVPSVFGKGTWAAETLGSGVTCAQTLNVPATSGQTTPSAYSAIVILSVPLPGTTGAPCTNGGCSVVYDVDVDGFLTSGGTPVGAKWMGTVGYVVATSGSPVLKVDIQPVASGTASSGTALPSSWSLTAQLDGTSKYIQLVLTTDALGTYTYNPISQPKYTQ